MPTLNIDNSDLVKYTRKLEKLNKSALPIAVRNSLNRAAKSMKVGDKFIEKEFKDNFIIRRPNFIKSHTGFQQVPFSEWNIDRMESSAGILKGKSKSGDSLKLQEEGGNLKRRNVPYADESGSEVRANTSFSKVIQARHYFKKYKNKKLGRHQISKNFAIVKTRRSIMLYAKNKDPETLYIFRSAPRIKKNQFIQPAGLLASRKIAGYYIDEAKKRVDKLARK